MASVIYLANGADVDRCTKTGCAPIYRAWGHVVGVAQVRGSLYGVARGYGAHDYVFSLQPLTGGAWKETFLWYGCELWNCDDGDHADQVFSTPDGSWGWRDRDGGFYGRGTINEWSFRTNAPRIWPLR